MKKEPCPKCGNTNAAKLIKQNGKIVGIMCKKCGYKLDFIVIKG